ncbi:glutathione S-transferase-like protein [Ochromonadaceae sp. CCMP2298]|nr:glutathione S-transferase-like protein [Ochromonadaceae sp. CCMP2298]
MNHRQNSPAQVPGSSVGIEKRGATSPTLSVSKFHHATMSEPAAAAVPWKPPSSIDELYAAAAGNKWSSINRPTAGARDDIQLPDGPAPLQLHSLFTPNGQKVSILLEELGVEYDAYTINIGKGEQFSSGFTALNPNGKIPALMDKEGPDGQPISLFESGSIVMYLAEKYKRFIPENPRLRAEVLNWVFWQMGNQGPMAGNFGHFFVYAPGDKFESRDYGAARYGMETQRLCDVLDKALAGKTYLVGEEYTIADIMCYPWFRQLQTGYKHDCGVDAKQFLNVDQYSNCVAWAERIGARPQVQRGLQVCHWNGQGKPWLEAAKEA